jgi:hypothetical protein
MGSAFRVPCWGWAGHGCGEGFPLSGLDVRWFKLTNVAHRYRSPYFLVTSASVNGWCPGRFASRLGTL